LKRHRFSDDVFTGARAGPSVTRESRPKHFHEAISDLTIGKKKHLQVPLHALSLTNVVHEF